MSRSAGKHSLHLRGTTRRRPLAPNERACRIDGCTTIHKRGLFACALHWHRLPAHYRNAIWGAYRQHGAISEEYLQAAENAEAFLEDRDAVDLFGDLYGWRCRPCGWETFDLEVMRTKVNRDNGDGTITPVCPHCGTAGDFIDAVRTA